MFELVLRLVFSLAVVIGLLLLLAKFSSRRFRGRSGALVQIVHRQPLSRSSAVAVVTVGTRVLVLGTTEQQVTVLAELDPDEIELPETGSDDHDGALPDEPEEPAGGAVEELRPRALAALSRGRAVRSVTTPTSRRSGRHAAPATSPATADGPLTGSVLSLDTWRQALAAATRVIS